MVSVGYLCFFAVKVSAICLGSLCSVSYDSSALVQCINPMLLLGVYRYRAPECLLTDGYYNHKMDLWGVGCVFFEVMR